MAMNATSGRLFRCYSDESGDEGSVWKGDGGATRWCVMAAVVVVARDELKTSRATDRIKNRFGLKVERPLHWVKRRDHRQGPVTAEELAKEPITVICVAVNHLSIRVVFARSARALSLHHPFPTGAGVVVRG